MATINELKKYLNYEFSSGPYTGEDYKKFQTKYINYLRSMCKNYGWELVNVGRNHYCFSAFVKNQENKYVYLSISDVRFLNNEWFYHGRGNHYTDLNTLPVGIDCLFQGL